MVQDGNGTPILNATITLYELEDKILVVAGREDFSPSIKVVGREAFKSPLALYALEPQVPITTIVFTILAIESAAEAIYDYAKNPEEFPIQFPGLVKGHSAPFSV